MDTCGAHALPADAGYTRPCRSWDLSNWSGYSVEPDITPYYPLSHVDEPVQAAILIDSFHWMTRTNAEGKLDYVYYVPEMLDYLWQKTGKVFMAVCSGGAALCKPHGRGATYEQLLAKVTHDLDMLVAVICGNDLLASGMKVAEYCPEWDEAAAVLCRGMKQKAVKQFAVVGGSSTCWSYASWMPDLQQALRPLSPFPPPNG